jgi:carbonic anhydrase/acetyltransferase-like protein (isoleucine patch superfamily)
VDGDEPTVADTSHGDSALTRLTALLEGLDHLPSWAEVAELGIPLVDLSQEEAALRTAIVDLEQTRDGFDAIGDADLAAATAADLADHRRALERVEARPGRYFLATGETVQHNDTTSAAHHTGWWYDERASRITTPGGERIHRPGIHPDAAIDTTATIDPTARIEAGTTIGPHTRVGRYVHISRDAIIAANTVIQDGTWIGTNTDLAPHTWISHGATIEPRATIGHHTTIGAGSRVAQRCQIEPYSRLGAGATTTTNPTPRSQRGVQIAHAVENLMRLDRE